MLQQRSNNDKSFNIPYDESEILAISLGFQEIIDDKAYKGRYFIKDGKKWIHNIEALRNFLGKSYYRYICDEELRDFFGYDVDGYYQYNATSSIKEYNGFKEILKQIQIH